MCQKKIGKVQVRHVTQEVGKVQRQHETWFVCIHGYLFDTPSLYDDTYYSSFLNIFRFSYNMSATVIHSSGKGEEENKSNSQETTDQKLNKAVSRFNPLVEYQNDPNPPLLRYVEEGKEITRKLTELNKQYRQEFRQKLVRLKKSAKKTAQPAVEFQAAVSALREEYPTLEEYKQKIQDLYTSVKNTQLDKASEIDKVFLKALTALQTRYPIAEAHRQKVKELYKKITPSEIDRKCAIVYKEDENGVVKYGAAVFRRDAVEKAIDMVYDSENTDDRYGIRITKNAKSNIVEERISKNIKNTALARYYLQPVSVQLPVNYKTMSGSDKLVFIRRQLYFHGTKAKKPEPEEDTSNYSSVSQHL